MPVSDVLMLPRAVLTARNDGCLELAAPPPVTAGKLEIRNVGLVDMPVTEAPICLVIRLDRDGCEVD